MNCATPPGFGFDPYNATFLAAVDVCNREIIGKVRQVICFLFHDSTLMMETCLEAKQLRKMVTTFFLD